jgi:hypothetical protein
MAKKDSAPADGPTVLVRKGRYIGAQSRGYDSVPFGERFVARPGVEYEVRETFSYLWKDPQFAAVWEWDGEPVAVPAVNPEQVKYE